jgi:tRNA(Arg) A34 adenosine deaminase TadA
LQKYAAPISGQVDPTEAEHAAMRDAIDRALKAAKQSGKAGIAATVMRAGKIIAVGENEVNLRCDHPRCGGPECDRPVRLQHHLDIATMRDVLVCDQVCGDKPDRLCRAPS